MLRKVTFSVDPLSRHGVHAGTVVVLERAGIDQDARTARLNHDRRGRLLFATRWDLPFWTIYWPQLVCAHDHAPIGSAVVPREVTARVRTR